MSNQYQAILPELKDKILGYQLENTKDTETLIGLPYPYTASGQDKRNALYYWDTFFINQALIKFKLVENARYNVENLIYLYRQLHYIPTSNHKQPAHYYHPPLMPWMIRDVYRATGDKEWLRRMLPHALDEFHTWTTKPHTSPSGLFRYHAKEENTQNIESVDKGLMCSLRFDNLNNVNPVDLNAILYRNAKLLYDLQIEESGKGDESLLHKSQQIKKLLEICWDPEENFYFDNDFTNKTHIKIKSLSGFMPLFVEMVDGGRAKILIQQLKLFAQPGGLSFTDKDYNLTSAGLQYPLTTAPCIYFIIKGLCDYEYMEDALDIGSNWLDMIYDTFKSSGEMWEWYNTSTKSVKPENGIANTPVMGWTAGTYIALLDTLGLH